ncbi:MAG: hypothetical protein KY453_01570 [Gemmatimonadetes bacterium]|nr:hypothetical protein [Gemmatimonadota bacterium]
MRTTTRSLRRLLSPLLASAMLVLSVAVPVLDTDRVSFAPVVESEHAPDQCVAGHDHTLCAQVGASRTLAASEIRLPLPTLDVIEPVTAPQDALHHLLTGTGHSTRAPPLT